MSKSANDIAKKLNLDLQTKVTLHLKPWLIWGGVILAVVLLIWFWTGRNSSTQVKYKTYEVKRGNLTVVVSATGTLQPTNQVDVGSEISGTIKKVYVDYNDKVIRGQILATIDTSKLDAQLKQTAASTEAASAHVMQTQATVTEAKTKLARLLQVQKASDNKVPSKAEMDTANANLQRAIADEANARASVIQTEATLEAQRTDLSKAVIRSPIKGVVLKRAAEPGQTVAATFQTPVLFTLAEDLTKMELHVDVDEADVGNVHEGQTATFTVDAYSDRIFPARITQVRFGSKTVAGVVTYETVLRVDNTSLLLRPGMTGTASITVQTAIDALLVSNAALRFTPQVIEEAQPASGGSVMSKLIPRPPSSASKTTNNAENRLPHVWILLDGKLEKIMLKTGISDSVLTEVKEGKLEPGMMIVEDVIESKK
jgi:HlyD family secretion protein